MLAEIEKKNLQRFELDEKSQLLVLKKDHRIVVPKESHIHIMQKLHDASVGGHAGVKKTLTLIARRFFWPKIKTSVEKFVDTCKICRQVKALNQ